jgi:pyrimidine operon attenuation protein / uracil phosphoribosyltransferase
MFQQQNLILDHGQTQRKIQRIAFEVYERNIDENELVFAGVNGGGHDFARILKTEFDAIAQIPSQLVKVLVDKKSPDRGEIQLDCPLDAISGKTIILTDDVLNTGRTLAYCLKTFLKTGIKKMQVAVLVDRDHRQFPISADFSGYSLSTTVNQHIEVLLDKDERFSVYLY